MNAFAICSLIGIIFYVLLFNWELLKIFLIVYGLYTLLTYAYYPFGFKFNTTRKKVGIVTWSQPSSPEIYGHIKIRFSKALAFIQKLNSTSNVHFTPTHLVVKALGDAIAKYPNLNCRIVFGQFVPYDGVDISCLVALDGGSDLTMACYRKVDQKSLYQIAEEASKLVNSSRTGERRKQHGKTNLPFKLLPTCLGGILGEIGSWISISLGLNLPFLGLEKSPGGVATITNIGMLGGELIYAPMPTLLRISVIFVMHPIKDDIVVENGEMKIDKVLTIAATVDHRFIDGVEALEAQNYVKKMLENPEEYFKF